MVSASVLVATTDPGPALLGLVRSVDAQTLPVTDFELVVADASTDGTRARLQELAGRRPNVVVVAAEPGTTEAELLALAREHASGERAIVLDQHRRLAPRALELLLAGGLDGSERIAADGYVVTMETVEPPSAAVAEVVVAAVALGWRAGLLHADVELREDREDLRAWLVVAREAVELEIPASVTGRTASAALDLRTAQAGDALEAGLWDLRLRLQWSDGDVIVPLPAVPTTAAVVSGRPYVVTAGEQGAQLDAGATRGGVTGRAPQATATVVESVRGVLLTLDQPDLHVHGDAELEARLALDGFVLPGRLVCRDGAARLEAYVGSLAGVSRIGIAVGGGVPVPTGLRLRVDGVGAMTVETVPPRRPKPSTPTGPSPLVQRLRRRAPGALEPAVRRLSRVPALRGAYRLLLTR